MSIRTGGCRLKGPHCELLPPVRCSPTQRHSPTHFAHFQFFADMIPSTLFVFVVAAMSSLVAVNGAVVQRDGTFVSVFGLRCRRRWADFDLMQTFTTPQPTSLPQGAGSTTATSSVLQTSSVPSTQPSTLASVASSKTTQSSVVTSSPSSSTPISSASIVPSSSPTTVQTITPCSKCTQSGTTAVSSPSISVTGTPSASPVPGAGTANCNGVQQWQAAFAVSDFVP